MVPQLFKYPEAVKGLEAYNNRNSMIAALL